MMDNACRWLVSGVRRCDLRISLRESINIHRSEGAFVHRSHLDKALLLGVVEVEIERGVGCVLGPLQIVLVPGQLLLPLQFLREVFFYRI